jgi:aminoglycoside phosphotransferase family enzyme/predicted kinase
VVCLIGDRAYKLKKPVDLGFLDFSSLHARREACRREVELNRRLSPDVYLGLATLTGPDGRECEDLVVMRRMPDARRLAHLVRTGDAGDAQMRAIARLVAAFHAGARRAPEISAEGSCAALSGRWTASFDQVRPFHHAVLDPSVCEECEHLVRRYLAGREGLLADRMRDGRIVDGHGDLLADDIFCLNDGPRILDCLEFDDRLRYLDELDDAAFLAMDLESLGAEDLARRYLNYYLEYSGDPAPASLLAHYLAYRAFVRVKVDCLRHAQGDPDAGEAARRLLGLTVRHLREGAVRLILVGGLPGTGKSTLAGGLADRLGMVVLSSDRIRKELAGIPPEAPAPAPYEEGLYSPDRTEAVYRELLARADAALGMGESVVLDASWTRKSHRDAARSLTDETSSDLVPLLCRAPYALTASRLTTGRRGSSDADAAIAAAMAQDTDPWPDAHVIDTTRSVEESLRLMLRQVGRTGPPEGP